MACLLRIFAAGKMLSWVCSGRKQENGDLQRLLGFTSLYIHESQYMCHYASNCKLRWWCFRKPYTAPWTPVELAPVTSLSDGLCYEFWFIVAWFKLSNFQGEHVDEGSGSWVWAEGLEVLLWCWHTRALKDKTHPVMHHTLSQTSYMRHKSGNGSNPTSNSLSSRLVDRGKQTDPRHSEWGFTN